MRYFIATFKIFNVFYLSDFKISNVLSHFLDQLKLCGKMQVTP